MIDQLMALRRNLILGARHDPRDDKSDWIRCWVMVCQMLSEDANVSEATWTHEYNLED